MKTITIGETTYTILFPDLLRPLTDRERQDLKDSIEKYGIKNPVIIDEDDAIIDGANRALIALELGLPTIPTRVVECENEEEKRQLALSLNLDRRHLSAEERAKMVEERRQRVRAARAEGKSLRAIAEEEKVSHEQIRKDLAADAGVNGLTPDEEKQSPAESEPAMAALDAGVMDAPSPSSPQITVSAPPTVKGRDGKRYPSSPKQRENGPSTDAASALTLSPEEFQVLAEANAALRACIETFHRMQGHRRIPKDKKKTRSCLDNAEKALAKVRVLLERNSAKEVS